MKLLKERWVHQSPPRYSAIGRLSEAIAGFEFRPQSIRKPVMRKDDRGIFPYMPFRLRVYAANPGFEGKLKSASKL